MFLDTEEEEYRQYVELAWEILWNMQEQRQLQGLEILQFVESRVQFENAVKEKLGVSKSYVKRIRFNWGRSFFEKNTSPIESVL